MKTYVARPEEIKRKWYIVDVAGKPLGRISSEVAKILRGKHKPDFTPYVDTGDHVIILNAEKVMLTGKKLDNKIFRYHTLHPGGFKEIKYRDLMLSKPERAVELAIKGMLPKNSLGRAMFRKLIVYRGGEHHQQAQMPEILEINL